MKTSTLDILNTLIDHPFVNQRTLAEMSGISLGAVNQALSQLKLDNYLTNDMAPTKKALDEVKRYAPCNAIIFADAKGINTAPINMQASDGLLEINGEPLVERLIKQLHAVDIRQIYIVVGYLKEKYEYLIDSYGVRLIVNKEYATKSSLHTMKLALPYLSNSYVIPSNVWFAQNPFSRHELYSWYAVKDLPDPESPFKINRKRELVLAKGDMCGDATVGMAYISKDEVAFIRDKIGNFTVGRFYNRASMEEALLSKGRMIVKAKIVGEDDAFQITSYEKLNELKRGMSRLSPDALQVICDVFSIGKSDIHDIAPLKKGMTNYSYLFTVKGKRYIIRVPGEGTNKLLDRYKEAEVYASIKDLDICDNVVYINPESGYKITEFVENSRTADPHNIEDLERCIRKLRQVHDAALTVSTVYDEYDLIQEYEDVWDGAESIYGDYRETKKKILSLREYTDRHRNPSVLSHLDVICDNFLLTADDTMLIDWEYAGMDDPLWDVAYFTVQTLIDKDTLDRLIDVYYDNRCPADKRIVIYCYVAVCGLIVNNWCESKRLMGIDFGEFSLAQYRYAKEYYKLATEEIKKEEAERHA